MKKFFGNEVIANRSIDMSRALANSIGKEMNATHKTKKRGMTKSKSNSDLYVPHVPFFCPVTKSVRDSEKVRDMLVADTSNLPKPRMTWYDPSDGMVPTDWFTDGIYADYEYYFADNN